MCVSLKSVKIIFGTNFSTRQGKSSFCFVGCGFPFSLKIWLMDGNITIVVLCEFRRNRRKLFSAQTFRPSKSGFCFLSCGFPFSMKIWVTDGNIAIVVLCAFR